MVATNILAVTSEAFPLAKTGGLGDAVTGMTRALHKAGTAITLMLPAYRGTLAQITDLRPMGRLVGLPGGEAELIAGRCTRFGLPVLLLRNDALYDRDSIYTDRNGQDYADNALRFAALAHAATRIAQGVTRVTPPQLIHAHDWHAGLVPLLMRAARVTNIKTVISLHNLAFQGLFPLHMAAELGIPAQYCNDDGMAFWGQLNFLKAGIRYADRVITVSQTYAREILTPQFGCGLEGLLQARQADLLAIANGIDDELWDPTRDPHLQGHCYTAGNLANKAHCKTALQREFGLAETTNGALLAMGSRLTTQKMADVAVVALPTMLDAHPELQVVIIGCGDKALERALTEMAARYPGRCAVHIGFDEPMAHRLHAGADLLLHGSRFEPFGLTPLYAMRYGTVPIGSRVGGMADTIRDPGPQAGLAAMVGATGVLFDGEQPEDMANAISRALDLRQHRAVWRAMQYNGMTSQFGWDNAAREYLRLYTSLLPPPAVAPAVTSTSRGQRKAKTRKAGARSTFFLGSPFPPLAKVHE